MNKIDDLIGAMKAKLTAARDIAAAAEKAGRDLAEDERSQIQTLMNDASGLKAQVEKVKSDTELRKSLSDLGDEIGLITPEEKAGIKTSNGLVVPDLSQKSLGDYFVESGTWKSFMQHHPNGRVSERARVQTDRMGFKSLLPGRKRGGQKALVTGASDTSAGAYVQNDWRGFVNGLELFERPLTMRDLVTNGTTQSDTVEYAKITAITNSAAPVAEATTAAMPTTGASAGAALTQATGGGYKPESGFTTVRETAVVKTIAHWIPATKRALSDAAQVRTLIDNFLQYGLEEELEDQMVSGSGSGENFSGILNVSGTQTQAYATDLLTTTRKAKTKVRTVGRARANGYVLNPADVEAIDLLKDLNGQFYFGGPVGAGTASGTGLWGLPVIESEAIPEGTGLVGDFTKAILWDREQSTISVTDSHGDFFVRNLVAILAEMRAAFGVIQPNAFVEIDLTSG